MLKTIQKLMAVLFKPEAEHKHGVVVIPDATIKLKKDLAEAKHTITELKKQATLDKNELSELDKHVSGLDVKLSDSVEQANLWMRKSADLQDKLSASLGHVTVLEGVLVESNKTIEALNLAIELREKEETEGLQSYIDELETEIDEAVELIQKYGLEMRKA